MKKLIITLCAAAVTGIGAYIYACVGEDFGISAESIFSPEVTVNRKAYQPLYLDYGNLFYDGDYIPRSALSFQKEDLASWKKYLAGNLPDKAIEHFMYDDGAISDVQKYNKAADKSKVALSYPIPQKNSGVVTNFFALLGIARANEYITNVPYDPWDYDENVKKEYTENSEIQKADKLYREAAASGDTFFANRMWLQVLRLKFYSNNRSSVISFFNETHSSQPKNSIYYRGLHYVAGAYKAQKNYAKANAALATLFNTDYNFKQTVTYEYHPLRDYEVNQIAATLPANEQCALWAMQGYYGSEGTAIQKMLSINPQSPHISFLLSRYINYFEGECNSIEIKTLAGYHQQRQKIATTNFQTDWLVQAAKKGNVADPYLWNAAAGYAEVFRNNYQEAKNFLQKAEELAKTPEQKAQIRLIDIFNEVSSLTKITPDDENRILKRLQWFNNSNIARNEYDYNMRSSYIEPFVRNYLSHLYTENGNPLMAAVVSSPRSYISKPQQAATFEQFMLKPNKNEWEQYWVDRIDITLGDLYEGRALYAFYSGEVDEALTQMKKIPYENTQQYDNDKGKWVTVKVKKSDAKLPANPFNGFITDCHDCEHAKGMRNPYSKLSFLEKVKEMKDKIAQNEDVYNNALLLGNAFYNCSYFGNNRAFYYSIVLGEGGGLGVEDANKGILLNMQIAKKYYELAQQHATNDEQRAKIAYMLAKVERNEFYTQMYFNNGEWQDYSRKSAVMFKDWKGFKELRKYPNTKYYKEVIEECGYFKKVARR